MTKVVLVVDDERDVREALADLVELMGYEVLTAENGVTALAQMRAARPSAVLLDLLMPVMSGWQVLAAMTADAALAGIPVILSTSAPSGSPPGMRVLCKPIDYDVLAAALAEICR